MVVFASYAYLCGKALGSEIIPAAVTEVKLTAALPEPYRVAVVEASGDLVGPELVNLKKLSIRVGNKTVAIPKIVYAECHGVVLRTMQLQYEPSLEAILAPDKANELEISLWFSYGAYSSESDRLLADRPRAYLGIVNGVARSLTLKTFISETEARITTIELDTKKRTSQILEETRGAEK